jgi:hypothetical protein
MEELFMPQKDDFVGWVIREDIFKECTYKLSLYSRVLLADLQVKDENKPRMFCDVWVMNAVASCLLLEYTGGHHYVPILKVISC